MSGYFGGGRSTRHLIDGGLFSGGGTGVDKYRHRIDYSRGLASAAKRLPNKGSTAARHQGGNFRNRAFKQLRTEIKKRGKSEDNITSRLSDRLGALWDKVDRIEWRVEVLKFFEDMGSDLASIGLAIAAEALDAIVWSLYEEYCETLIELWFSYEQSMNNGQVVITEIHYLPEIVQWLDEQRETGMFGEAKWPYQTDTYEYIDRVIYQYDQDVWARAFTDTTDAPLGPCEEIRELAMAAQGILYSI